MKRLSVFPVLFAFLICGCSLNGTYPPAHQNPGIGTTDEGTISGEIVVGIDRSRLASEIDPLVPGRRIRNIAAIGTTLYLLYALDNPTDTDSVIMYLNASGKVKLAEKNALYSLCVIIPNDTYYKEFQYAPKITDCEDGWEIETGKPEVIVGVIDTGINGTHEDLAGRVVEGKNMLTGETILQGVNSDDIGHGTHVSGIIAAAGNNNAGIAGVAWNIRLMPVKIFAPDGFPSSAIVTEAIVYAVDHGAKVLNMSIGGGIYSMMVSDAVNYAYEHDVLIVAAMGNDGKTKVNYPAALPGVLAVGCTNGRDEVSYFSTMGNNISVCAPGENIYSLSNILNTGCLYMSGTSMSTPFVSGLAALLFSRDAALTPDEVRSMIEDSADLLGAEQYSPVYGNGRVNVFGALTISKRNNYGTIKVAVTNNGSPIGGIKVLLEDTSSASIVSFGLTSSGSDAGGINGEIVFHHLPFGTYKALVKLDTAKNQTITISDALPVGTASFTFNTPMVLIVNGIKTSGPSLLTDEFLYEEKLTSLGKYFSIWKVAYNGPPPLSLVTAYDTVVWFTEATADDPGAGIEVLNENEVNVIKTFLYNGGKMYLCGNNIAEHLSQTDASFLENYLHATLVHSELPHDQLFGYGFLFAMEISLNSRAADQIEPGTGATALFDASDELGTKEWAGVSWNTGYRLVYTTFTPNDIGSCVFTPSEPGYYEEDLFFENIIKWLDSSD